MQLENFCHTSSYSSRTFYAIPYSDSNSHSHLVHTHYFEDKTATNTCIPNQKKAKVTLMIVKLYYIGLYWISLFVGSCLKKKFIVFESIPDFSGSPEKIYHELKKRNYDKKYIFVWAIDKTKKDKSALYKTVYFWVSLNFFERQIKTFILMNTSLIIDSNRYIYKIKSKTIRLHTRHGGTLKSVPEYSEAIGNVDYILSLSDEMAKIEIEKMFSKTNLHPHNFLIFGYPNNDQLFEPVNSYTKDFLYNITANHKTFNKIIGWMPTYREHKNSLQNNSRYNLIFGLPLLHQSRDLDCLNNLLLEKNILLVVMYHHSQLLHFPKLNYSNIVIISQECRNCMHISLIDLIKSFDALITDYSSIYHEYLLLNRPIALAIDDFKSYSSSIGFCFNYFDWIKGIYLYNLSDLLQFIEDVSNDIDLAKDEREKIKFKIHKYIDNQSTKRVADFLIEKAKL